MLRYAMLHCVLLCKDVLCYDFLCFTVFYYDLLCYVTLLCNVTFCYVIVHGAMLCYVNFNVTLCYGIVCYVILYHVIFCYAMLSYIKLCYVFGVNVLTNPDRWPSGMTQPWRRYQSTYVRWTVAPDWSRCAGVIWFLGHRMKSRWSMVATRTMPRPLFIAKYNYYPLLFPLLLL